MKRLLILAAAVLLLTALSAHPTQAGPLNGLGRHLGWGWSDGYHARPYNGHGYYVHPGSWRMQMIEPAPGDYIEPIPQGAEGPYLPPAPVTPPADDDVAPGKDTWLPGTLRRDTERLLPEAWRPSRPYSR